VDFGYILGLLGFNVRDVTEMAGVAARLPISVSPNGTG
jgi:hypothetical protein